MNLHQNRCEPGIGFYYLKIMLHLHLFKSKVNATVML